jgi:hypothetical protein
MVLLWLILLLIRRGKVRQVRELRWWLHWWKR